MDIDAMFSQVPNSYLLKEGDIIVWPGETGPIKHLHGKPATFRRLGMSVGRTYRAVPHCVLGSVFRSEPEKTRLLMVTKIRSRTTEMSAEEAARNRLFSTTTAPLYTGPRTLSVSAVRFPYDLSPKNWREVYQFLDVVLPDYIAGMDLFARVFAGSTDRILGMNTKPGDIAELNGAMLELDDRLSRNTIRPGVEDNLIDPNLVESQVLKNGVRLIGDTICDNDTAHSMCNVVDYLPTKVIDNAARYGVTMIRPTDGFLSVFASGVIGLSARGYSEASKTIENRARELASAMIRQLRALRTTGSRNETLSNELTETWDIETGGLSDFVNERRK